MSYCFHLSLNHSYIIYCTCYRSESPCYCLYLDSLFISVFHQWPCFLLLQSRIVTGKNDSLSAVNSSKSRYEVYFLFVQLILCHIFSWLLSSLYFYCWYACSIYESVMFSLHCESITKLVWACVLGDQVEQEVCLSLCDSPSTEVTQASKCCLQY